MAKLSERRAENAAGDFFVDETCIDCDACRWIAPKTFDRDGEKSRVHAQPEEPADVARALQALVACPTASIGTTEKHDTRTAADSFPEVLPGTDGRVLHNGFHHKSTFGAASFLLLREGGNVLIDSPRYSTRLADRIEALGGVSWMFLTHKDDVGDHARFAERFGAKRVLHEADASGALLGVEVLVDGEDPVELEPGLRVFPMPGHTRGSACLQAEERFLFSGDHVAWSWRLERIYAFRTACWFDWDVQIESMRRLAEERFEWILPGHGRMCTFEADDMRRRMRDCVDWMVAQR